MDKLSKTEIISRLQDLDGWELQENHLSKTFTFKDFKEAFATMSRIAFEAEAQNHHPDWKNVYNTLHIQLNTHDAGGVTEKDFHLAHTIEHILTS